MIQTFNRLSPQSISSRFYVNLRRVNTSNVSFLSRRSLRTTTSSYIHQSSQNNKLQEQSSNLSQDPPHPLGPKNENPFGIGPTREKPHSEGHAVNKAKDFSGSDSSEGFVKKVKNAYNQATSALDVQAESAALGLKSHNEAVKGGESKSGSDNVKGLGTVQEKIKETAGNAKEAVKGSPDSATETAKDILQDATKESREATQGIKEKGQESKKSMQEKGQEISKGSQEKIKDLKETSQDLLNSLKEQGQDVLKKAQDTLKKSGQEVMKNLQAKGQDAKKNIDQDKSGVNEREH